MFKVNQHNAKSTLRAIRIHHVNRIKKNRAHYGRQPNKTEKQIGLIANTATLCSCYLCGNPRKYFGEPSLQERMNLQRHDYNNDCLSFYRY